MKTFNVFSVIALILTIIGALNWLSVGVIGFNFVAWVTFGMAWIERAVYALVGAAGVFMIVWLAVSHCRMVNDTSYSNKYAERKAYGSN